MNSYLDLAIPLTLALQSQTNIHLNQIEHHLEITGAKNFMLFAKLEIRQSINACQVGLNFAQHEEYVLSFLTEEHL
jgi:hypothetical protein